MNQRKVKIIKAEDTFLLEGLINDFLDLCPDSLLKSDFFSYWNGNQIIVGVCLTFEIPKQDEIKDSDYKIMTWFRFLSQDKKHKES